MERDDDEWRVEVEFKQAGHAAKFSDLLGAWDLEHDARHLFRDRVIVSRDGARVFLYADTRDLAEATLAAVAAEARKRGWTPHSNLRRWHPIAEEWESPDIALPADASARATERGELMRRERRDAEERGYPEFEVRVDLSSRRSAMNLERSMRAKGLSVVRRWKYVLIAATDEDNARELACRIRRTISSEGRVTVEGTAAAVSASSLGPFAVFAAIA